MNSAALVRRATRRRRVVAAAFFVAGVALLARAVHLQHYQQDMLRQEGEARQVRAVTMPALRGAIEDRNGELLAISAPAFAVWVDPREFGGADAAAQLAELLDAGAAARAARAAADAGRRFVYLRRRVLPEVAARIRRARLPGVHLSREYHRYYPHGEIAAQLVGITDIDGVGIEGLEKSFDAALEGRPGEKRILRDRRGRTIADLELLRAPRPGARLRLALDRRMQYRAYRALKAAVVKRGAAAGVAVLLDARSGEILALANQPSFNPNDRGAFSSAGLRNRAFIDRYEPGSTIKPFVAAALLEHGHATPADRVNTSPGRWRHADYVVRDYRDYGVLDMTGVLVKSSNIGISRLAQRAPVETLWATFRGLGFGDPPGAGFPGEDGGVLRPFAQWSATDRVIAPFGYGLSATPVQLAAAYAALANDGLLPELSLLRRDQPPRTRRVFSAETARTIKAMLAQVVAPGGTGARGKVPGFATAGKTGTARKHIGGAYVQGRYVSMFAGFAPVEKPRLVAVVIIDDPRDGSYFGGEVAAPVFAEIMRGALRTLGAPEDEAPPGSDGAMRMADALR